MRAIYFIYLDDHPVLVGLLGLREDCKTVTYKSYLSFVKANAEDAAEVCGSATY